MNIESQAKAERIRKPRTSKDVARQTRSISTAIREALARLIWGSLQVPQIPTRRIENVLQLRKE